MNREKILRASRMEKCKAKTKLNKNMPWVMDQGTGWPWISRHHFWKLIYTLEFCTQSNY